MFPNQNESNKTPQKGPGNDRQRQLFYIYIAMVVVLIINWFVFPSITKPQVAEVTYDQFMQMLDKKVVGEVQMDQYQINFNTTENGQLTHYKTGYVNDPTLAQKLQTAGVRYGSVIQQPPNLLLSILLSYGLPLFLLFFLFSRMQRGGGFGGLQLGKSNAKEYVQDDAAGKKTFKDVAGADEAKDSLIEVVDYLRHPEKYKAIGAESPKGILLVGPPGTGKTLLAKAVAGEANVPFISISGSEFVELFVGRGAARVRDLFEQANKKAPCIVFIDEIDAIGKKRDSGLGIGGNDEREQTLNQLLAEMDGFDGNKGVIILAATNRPEILDAALLRPGRFDRQVRVELPDVKGREAILQVHARDYQIAPDVNWALLARATPGASGAQLENIINEAALRAVRMGRDKVAQEDLEESIETVIAGQQKKNTILSPKEKRIVAYHEIGHALVAASQTGQAPVHKITIIPRTGGALGYTMQVEEEEKFLMTRTDAMARLATLAGGRAAEEVIFADITSGAANDIEQMTKLARAMVTRFGMTEQFGMVAMEQETGQYLGGVSQSIVSPATQEKVDEAVRDIIQKAHRSAKEILSQQRQKLDALTEHLIKEESITGEEFMQLLKQQEGQGKAADKDSQPLTYGRPPEEAAGSAVAGTPTASDAAPAPQTPPPAPAAGAIPPAPPVSTTPATGTDI